MAKGQLIENGLVRGLSTKPFFIYEIQSKTTVIISARLEKTEKMMQNIPYIESLK